MSDDKVMNGAKVVSEAIFAPGSSLLIDGDVKNGVLHLAGGLAAKTLLGPAGWALAAANSYSLSTTNRHLHEHFMPAAKESSEEASA